MNRNYTIFAIFIISVLSVVLPAFAQQNVELNRLLSSLRGKWEWHDFDDVQTFNFQSDSLLVYNRKPGTYTINDNTLKIQTLKESVILPFTLNGNRLNVTSTEGKVLTFNKEENGEAEQYLVNTFYSADDINAEFIFQQNGAFWFYPPVTTDDTKNTTTLSPTSNNTKTGVYRVEQNLIHLTFDDGTINVAFIHNIGGDNMVDQIIYNNQNYFRPLPQENDTTIIVYQPTPYPHPRPPHPPEPPYCPPPTHPIHPIKIPGNPIQPNGKSETEKRRDFGSTHSNPEHQDSKREPSGTNTGSRGGRP